MSDKLFYKGTKYDSKNCEYIATYKGNLACHIQSVYKWCKYEYS